MITKVMHFSVKNGFTVFYVPDRQFLRVLLVIIEPQMMRK